MSPIGRQGLRETAIFTGILLAIYAVLYLAGDRNLNWFVPLSLMLAGVVRTAWREYRFRRNVASVTDQRDNRIS